MESVGQELRLERLRQGLTLNDVTASTRIPIKHLIAIEGDDVSQFTSAFFYKSFVRQFAEFLHLDFSTLSESVQQSACALPEPRIPGQDGAFTPKVASLHPHSTRNFRWVYSVTSLVAVLVACSTLYAVWRNSKGHLQTAATELYQSFARTPPSSPSLISKAPAGNKSARQAPVPVTPQASALPSQTPASSELFKVQVSAVEKTWLSIVSDGTRIYSGILQAEQSKFLEGHDSATIKTGNAGGLEVVFNGKEIGPLGAKGQVRTVLFTRDNFEIVPPPVHIALTMFTRPVAE